MRRTVGDSDTVPLQGERHETTARPTHRSPTHRSRLHGRRGSGPRPGDLYFGPEAPERPSIDFLTFFNPDKSPTGRYELSRGDSSSPLSRHGRGRTSARPTQCRARGSRWPWNRPRAATRHRGLPPVEARREDGEDLDRRRRRTTRRPTWTGSHRSPTSTPSPATTTWTPPSTSDGPRRPPTSTSNG